MAVVFCKNCGGDFDANEPKCPFCGYINYSGAEKKYMDDLGKIRNNLDDVDDAVVRDNKKMVKKYGIIIGCVAVIATLIVFLIVLISKWNEERLWGDRVDPKEQLLWENENFPQLEAWFEEGNYAAILEFENQMYLEESPYNLYGFEYKAFLDVYRSYDQVKWYIEDLNEDRLSKPGAASFTYNVFKFYYQDYLGDYVELTEEELEIIDGYREEVLDCFYNRMKFTDEEAEALREKVFGEGYLDFSETKAYAESVYERYE